MDGVPSRSGAVWRAVAAVCIPSVAIMALTVLGSVVLDRPTSFFIRDPGQTLHVHELIGAQSHVGILIWAACAGICFHAWAVSRGPAWRRDADAAAFFLCAALLTSVLVLDDLFRIHDSLFPRLGLREKPLLAAYVLATGLFTVRFRRIILKSRETALLYFGAGLFFLLSIIVDLGNAWLLPEIPDPEGRDALDEVRLFAEDGFKLFGIVAWTAFFARQAWLRLASGPTAVGEAPQGG